MLDDMSAAPKHGALAFPTPPTGVAPDWTVPQDWSRYTAEDHAVWDFLFARQMDLLPGRAVNGFFAGVDALKLDEPGVPELERLNERLEARTGWQVVCVPGLVPDDVFFNHLSQRRFPAGNFIRTRAQLDYLEEPDVFHDVFGHVPLLADPAVADFMEALGALGLDALSIDALPLVARLYWHTVEFGLARQDGGLRIYGAGILSSFGETRYSLESPIPHRHPFDLTRVLRTRYRSDAMQRTYFVIDRFEDALALVDRLELAGWRERLTSLPDLHPETADGSPPDG